MMKRLLSLKFCTFLSCVRTYVHRLPVPVLVLPIDKAHACQDATVVRTAITTGRHCIKDMGPTYSQCTGGTYVRTCVHVHLYSVCMCSSLVIAVTNSTRQWLIGHITVIILCMFTCVCVRVESTLTGINACIQRCMYFTARLSIYLHT